MPDGLLTFVYRDWRARAGSGHELPDVLPRASDHVSDISDTPQIGCRLDQLCTGDRSPDVTYRPENGLLSRGCAAIEIEGDAAWSSDAYERIVAALLGKAFEK
ncbi:MAG: hypothetical protein WCJ13_04450 [Coriobacteriia bacterium]